MEAYSVLSNKSDSNDNALRGARHYGSHIFLSLESFSTSVAQGDSTVLHHVRNKVGGIPLCLSRPMRDYPQSCTKSNSEGHIFLKSIDVVNNTTYLQLQYRTKFEWLNGSWNLYTPASTTGSPQLPRLPRTSPRIWKDNHQQKQRSRLAWIPTKDG